MLWPEGQASPQTWCWFHVARGTQRVLPARGSRNREKPCYPRGSSMNKGFDDLQC